MKTIYIFLGLLAFATPNFAQVNTNRVLTIGKNALYFEDYVLSIQYFNQVIKAKPYLAEPYFYRAVAKLSLDDYQGAEADFTLCIERNPFMVLAWQYRGAARQSLNNYEGAIEDYNKGLESRPEDKQMLLNKAIAFLQQKKYDEAIEVLNLLLKYQPRFTSGYLTRGATYSEKGDTLAAFSDYDKVLELDKYYAPAYAQRAMLYFQSGKYDEALKDFDQAIHLENKQVGYHINRGLVRYHLHNLRGAMADYDWVIKNDPNNRIARFNRGLLRAQVGDVYGSLDDFNQIIVWEPDNYNAIYNRVLLHNEAGNYTDAIDDLNRVIDEYPNFVPAYYFRSELKRKLKKTKEADIDYWAAYDLEQKLNKLREQGKIVTGKSVYDSRELADTENDSTFVRESSDKDIAKFNRLVVYDKEDELQSKYKNEIRGRVQDKQVNVDLEPQFAITYYESTNALESPVSRIDKTVSDYNHKGLLDLLLKIVNHEAPLTDDQAAHHFQSIDRYSLILDRNPADAEAYFARAIDFMVLQDLSEAIDDFGRAITNQPDMLLAYFNRAVVRYKQIEISGSSENFDRELILRDYESVIRLNPDFVYAYFNRANIKCLQKDHRAALTDYNEAIKRNPDFAEAYFNRGLTRLYLGETNRGIDDLSKAGELGIVSAYSIIKKMAAD
ncbi:MAG: tetratricopeptide repeat protein [Candidatus Symbiothrix sp.]|jgi:tetratricopeptide (TPR) repeat protein|nr:tetratricopeptide repeat protein [Candidatus Symbiothrix sp.]